MTDYYISANNLCVRFSASSYDQFHQMSEYNCHWYPYRGHNFLTIARNIGMREGEIFMIRIRRETFHCKYHIGCVHSCEGRWIVCIINCLQSQLWYSFETRLISMSNILYVWERILRRRIHPGERSITSPAVIVNLFCDLAITSRRVRHRLGVISYQTDS